MGEELPQGWCQPGGEQQARGGGELVGRHSGPKQVSHRALSVPGQSTRVLSFLFLIMCGFMCHFLSDLFSCQFFKSFTHLPTRVKRYHLHIVYFHLSICSIEHSCCTCCKLACQYRLLINCHVFCRTGACHPWWRG